MIKTPNWRKADQLAIYKRGRGVELGTTEKQIQAVAGVGLELGSSRLRVQRANHSATLPPAPKEVLTDPNCRSNFRSRKKSQIK